jgi:exosortase family protein XrtF
LVCRQNECGNDMLNEFRPTILFLVKFVGIYFLGNLAYGLWITHYHPRPDPMTSWVTEQSAQVLNITGWEVNAYNHPSKPTTNISSADRGIVAVYEGCNGINVMIVFLAFLLAFGPYTKKLLWFVPLGLLVIHVSNLLRIILLAVVVVHLPDYLYFTHKYLFTAFIYLFVFLLWIWWVVVLAKGKNSNDQA